MITILSPAKTLDFESPLSLPPGQCTEPDYLNEAETLISILRQYSPQELTKLMKVSDTLSTLTVERYHQWERTEHLQGTMARPAVFAFMGEVYRGLDAASLDEKTVSYAQDHLRILSGLYGLLRPLDRILPHRLEMGSSLVTEAGSKLYAFWGSRLTEDLERAAATSGSSVVVDLASREYFQAVQGLAARLPVVRPVFKEQKRSGPRIVGVYAKQQRGRMARYILERRINEPEQLKEYSQEGYTYSAELSSSSDWVFLR